MPYKNVEDRRACWNRWYQKHKETKKYNGRIQAKAKYYNLERKVCSIKNCKTIGERHHPDYNKPAQIIWLCKKHHEQIHKKEPKYCGFPNCNRLHWAKGFCNKHYKQYKRMVK